jgi:hypothetical protein
VILPRSHAFFDGYHDHVATPLSIQRLNFARVFFDDLLDGLSAPWRAPAMEADLGVANHAFR